MPGPAFLRGDTVVLCPVEEEDLPFLQAGDNDPGVRRWAGGDATPVTLSDEREYWEGAGDRDAVQLLVVAGDTPDGDRAGYVELDPVDRTAGVAEVGYWLAEGYRGRGYATEALELVVAYAFDELRLHRVTATVSAPNERSIEILRGVGFREEGITREDALVDGTHVDTHHFGVLAREWPRD